jgi:hypothetical protein
MANISELIHGRKPEVAPFIPTDPLEMLKKLLSGEIESWPQIAELGELFQSTMMDQLSNIFPNISEVFRLGGENTQKAQETALRLQHGELPPEDIAAIFRTSAGQNLKSGQLMSSMGGANALRNIGMGTLEGQLKGQDLATSAGNAAQRWMAMAQSTLLPPSAYLYSPEWFSTFMAQQAAAKQATKQFKYNVEAAPDPQWADRAKMLASLLGSFAGPGGGNMGNQASSTYAANWGGNVGQGVGAGVNFGGGDSKNVAGYQGVQPPNQNPGFLTNYMTAYRTPGNEGTGAGGTLGNFFGNIFNSAPQGGY